MFAIPGADDVTDSLPAVPPVQPSTHLHDRHCWRLVLIGGVLIYPVRAAIVVGEYFRRLRRASSPVICPYSAAYLKRLTYPLPFVPCSTCKLGQASHLGPFPRVYEQGSCCLPSLHAAVQRGSAYLAAELSPTSPCLVGRRFPRPELQLARLMFRAYKKEGAHSAAKLIYLFCSFYCSKNPCHLNHVSFSHSNSISIHSNDFRFLLT
jgi:hypothetical protein